MAEEAKWYVINTYSGYENSVAVAINKAAENRRMQDYIREICIPMEKVTEITEKGTKEVERKVFPGYVLIKMVMTEDSWHLVRRVRGVTGFVGDVSNDGSGSKLNIVPLTEEEAIAMGVERREETEDEVVAKSIERREVKVGYKVGDTVQIVNGVFTGRKGVVEEIDVDADYVRVTVSMFNRGTPIDLKLNEVELEKD